MWYFYSLHGYLVLVIPIPGVSDVALFCLFAFTSVQSWLLALFGLQLPMCILIDEWWHVYPYL